MPVKGREGSSPSLGIQKEMIMSRPTIRQQQLENAVKTLKEVDSLLNEAGVYLSSIHETYLEGKVDLLRDIEKVLTEQIQATLDQSIA